jgi:hypothetical protein
MLLAQVGVDDRLELVAGVRVVGGAHQPGPHLSEAFGQGLFEQLLLALEMAVEASVRQAEIPHQVDDRDLHGATAAKTTGGGADDSFVHAIFVVFRVAHL